MRTTTDDMIVMLARRARAARRRVREVEAYHRRVAHGELARLAQELSAARLATQDADERAQARERELDDARRALADALATIEARDAKIRRLRREVEIRDAGIEMGVALVRWWEHGTPQSLTVPDEKPGASGWLSATYAQGKHDADERARAAHPLNRTGGAA